MRREWTSPSFTYLPWITVGILLLMLYMISGTLTSSRGMLVNLPNDGQLDECVTPLTALMTRNADETTVFYDDARYLLGDARSVAALSEQLGERVRRLDNRAMTVIADRRVPYGEVMEFAAVARQAGVEKLLFAERRRGAAEE